MSFEHRQERIKEIEAYQNELRAKPREELQALYDQEQTKERHEQQAKAELEERQRFFNQSHAKADLVHWSKAPYWTLDEAIALSFGKAPEVVKWESVKGYCVQGVWLQGVPFQGPNSPFAVKYGRVRELALRAKASKQLSDPVLPSIFLAWARRMEIEVPAELVAQIEARGHRYCRLERQSHAQ